MSNTASRGLTIGAVCSCAQTSHRMAISFHGVRSVFGRLRLLQSHQEPLLGTIFAKVNQDRSLLLGEIVESRLEDICLVVSKRECNPLCLPIERALNDLVLAGRAVGGVASNHSLLIDRQLKGGTRLRLVGLG